MEVPVLLSGLDAGEGTMREDRDIGLDEAARLMASREEVVFLTTKEAADLARLSPRSLERMRGEGRGPRYCKIGGGAGGKRGRAVYRRSYVIAWLMETTL